MGHSGPEFHICNVAFHWARKLVIPKWEIRDSELLHWTPRRRRLVANVNKYGGAKGFSVAATVLYHCEVDFSVAARATA